MKMKEIGDKYMRRTQFKAAKEGKIFNDLGSPKRT